MRIDLHDDYCSPETPRRPFYAAPIPSPVTEPWRGRGPHWVDMRSVCQTLVDEASARAIRQHVTIDLSLCALPACVIGYAGLLATAIGRLMHSALDAMPNGGTLTLHVERDPFVVIELSTTGAGRAAGGIDAARAIVEAHRGYVWQRPLPHGGIWFIVELPMAGPRRRVSSEDVDPRRQDAQ